MKNFAITGVAGYIAPRHLKAIKDTGNTLVAAVDTHDSVGILDRYFPGASFFTEFERFDRHLEKMRRSGSNAVDYVSICSPNNLHDAHIRFALRIGATAISEKPLVLNPWNLDMLEELEQEFGNRVFNILQLRVHPSLLALKEKIANNGGKRHQVELSYISMRGPWYRYSWKGDIEKSGGIATNIGVHFFDLLLWMFGPLKEQALFTSEASRASGFVALEDADVRWFLSIDGNDLPASAVEDGRSTHRSIMVDGEEVEFTDGFTDLHTVVYQNILEGKGFGISDVRPSIELVHAIRTMKTVPIDERAHPYLNMLTTAKD
jgi:UDP-N-acetyl-2-amino-2-deoxyglucuronate dehydrogenase